MNPVTRLSAKEHLHERSRPTAQSLHDLWPLSSVGPACRHDPLLVSLHWDVFLRLQMCVPTCFILNIFLPSRNFQLWHRLGNGVCLTSPWQAPRVPGLMNFLADHTLRVPKLAVGDPVLTLTSPGGDSGSPVLGFFWTPLQTCLSFTV